MKSVTKKISKLVILSLVLSLFLNGFSGIAVVQAAESSVDHKRLAGQDRYHTANAILESIVETNGKVDSVIVSYGGNFPDALSGGYLSLSTNSPIMLVNKAYENAVVESIKENVNSGGKVYLLGGTGVVSSGFESKIKSAGYDVKRLAGSNRYETNLRILEECGGNKKTLLVAYGENYADSLSGSSVGLPMMLVKDKLNANQKNWLQEFGANNIVILGGEKAVSKEIENALKEYAPISRIGGKDRWETSALIANKLYTNVSAVTLATGKNFPDALCGAYVAGKNKAPIILISDSDYSYAKNYVKNKRIKKDITLGGWSSLKYVTIMKVMDINGQATTKLPTLSSLKINEKKDTNILIDKEIEKLEGVVFEVAGEYLKNLSPYDKMYYTLFYVGGTYYYSFDSYKAESMIKTGGGTCFAYSELTLYILKKLGLTCWLSIPGRHDDNVQNGFRGSSHRSVIVKIGSQYYDADSNSAANGGLAFGMVPEKLGTNYALYLIGQRSSF